MLRCDLPLLVCKIHCCSFKNGNFPKDGKVNWLALENMSAYLLPPMLKKGISSFN